MRKHSYYILLILALITYNISVAQEAFRFEGQVAGIKDTTCMLAYYYGDKQYAKDTADVDNEGRFVFSGTDTLDHGMYMVVLPDGNYFEMVVTENRFSFATSIDDLIGSMKFTNSYENEKFYGYMQFISEKQKALKKFQELKENASDDEAKKIDSQIEEMGNVVMNFQ
jgi:hypothetical protein